MSFLRKPVLVSVESFRQGKSEVKATKTQGYKETPEKRNFLERMEKSKKLQKNARILDDHAQADTLFRTSKPICGTVSPHCAHMSADEGGNPCAFA